MASAKRVRIIKKIREASGLWRFISLALHGCSVEPRARDRKPVRSGDSIRGSRDGGRPPAKLEAAHCACLGPHVVVLVAVCRRNRESIFHQWRAPTQRYNLRAGLRTLRSTAVASGRGHDTVVAGTRQPCPGARRFAAKRSLTREIEENRVVG